MLSRGRFGIIRERATCFVQEWFYARLHCGPWSGSGRPSKSGMSSAYPPFNIFSAKIPGPNPELYLNAFQLLIQILTCIVLVWPQSLSLK